MAEWQPEGQPDDDDLLPGAEEEDDAVEGTVVPFPRPSGQPAPPPRRAAHGQRGEVRDVIPAHLRTLAGIRRAVLFWVRRWRKIILFHLVRLPKMLVQACAWAPAGAARIEVAAWAWALVTEQAYLRGMAIEANAVRDYMQIHKDGKETRLFRVSALSAAHVAILVLGVAVTVKLPLLWVPAGLVLVPFLAAAGRPDGSPIAQSAVVPTSYEMVTQGLIVRALGSLGLAGINQALAKDPDGAIVPFGPVTRDGEGWRADEELPHGVTAAEVMEKRDKLASGLRRPIGCVWPENDRRKHPGALVIYVSDEDMSKADQPPWPLARRGTADMFKPVPFATDQRGRPITVTLMFVSMIIGSIPRMGKTFYLRLFLLICALDVRAEEHVYDLKGTGDLSALRQVAHRYRAGDEPEDIEYLIADYRHLRTEMRRRTKVIREFAEAYPESCPENKVTPELSSRRDMGLHPIVIGVDECQVMFESKYGDEFEQIATDLAKRGPALGILQILATQRPDAKSIPTGISANVVLRLCLKVMGQTENDMVLGTSAYKNGTRATMFDFEDKGIAYFSGEGSAPRIIRGQKVDGPEAKEIAKRARIMREHAGRITGYALGEDQDATDARRILDDVLTVFGDAKALWSSTIAERLAGSFPEAYADITQDAVASQLRALEVDVRGVRETGRTKDGPRSGCYRAEIERASGGGDA